jgi:chemotaxis signal transduction protein
MTDHRLTAGGENVEDASRRLLEERARHLAAPLRKKTGAENAQNTLVFRRGGERFGLPLDVVVEVQRGPALAHIPTASPPVIGVIGWRGRILTVIDPGNARPDSSDGDREWRAVIVGQSRARIVIYADAVDDALELGPDDCRPLDDAAPAAAARIPVRGITGDALVLVDGVALLERYPG